MKPRKTLLFRFTAIAALLPIYSVHAVSGTWNGTSGDWGTLGTWYSGNITFTDLTTASNNLTISGANILTLDRTTGAPIIDVTQTSRTLFISSQISSADGLQKNGTGILSLSGSTRLYFAFTPIPEPPPPCSGASACSCSSAADSEHFPEVPWFPSA